MTGWPVGAGAATGIGSMPGTDPRDATATVAGELPDLPHLVECPDRGPGADLIGRSAALLVDLHVDLQPSGWRLVERPGVDERRAGGYLRHDLDELEAAVADRGGPVKTQLCGPWTLAAGLRLPRGEPVLSDEGAVRDLVASLAEAAAAHVGEIQRRLPGASLLLQLDEPSLPAVLAGTIPFSSGARHVSAVPAGTAEEALRAIAAAVGVPVAIHCCAPRPPVRLLHAAGAAAVSLDVTLLDRAADEELAEAVESGCVLLAGVVPSVGAVSDPATTVEPVLRLWRRLGLSAETLRTVVVTPTCGLAGSTPMAARVALGVAREAGHRLAEDPDGELRGGGAP